MAEYTDTYEGKYQFLVEHGLLPFEAEEIADKSYHLHGLRELIYFRRIYQYRMPYLANLRKRGFTEEQIKIKILRKYREKEWATKEKKWGRNIYHYSPFAMVKWYRKRSIDEGEYTIPIRKGSHHKTSSGHPPGSGWSAGKRKEQRERRKVKNVDREYWNDRIVQAYKDGNTTLAHKLERERNKRFGY